MSEATVIMPRRNFLARAFGLTAAGATIGLPIVTVADARARAEHHVKELYKAIQDLYPLSTFYLAHQFPEGMEVDPRVLGSSPTVISGVERWRRPYGCREHASGSTGSTIPSQACRVQDLDRQGRG
jgi:hypothetical protein